jgi:steroid delta-isomerase-like uncharacterized protein
MSAEQNKVIVERMFNEVINQRKSELFEELIAPTYVNYSMPTPTPGPEGLKQVLHMFYAAFPDMKITIHEVIAEGDSVASRGTWYGTHRGEFNGIPATGKQVAVDYIDIWRFKNGQAVENWVQMDMIGMLQQLGVMPTPAGA